MTPERLAAEAIDRAAMVDGIRFSITGAEAVEAISGAGLVVMTAERAAQLLEKRAPAEVTALDLAALEAAAKAATPGPWAMQERIVYEVGGIQRHIAVAVFGGVESAEQEAANMDHIAAWSPSVALALLARLRRAEEALREIADDCEADYPPSHGAIKYAARAALAGTEGARDV